MNICLRLFFVALASKLAEGSIANFLADRAVAKVAGWVQKEGANWLTVPGSYVRGTKGTGPVAPTTYLVSIQGPTMDSWTVVSRNGDASIKNDDEEDNVQHLSFQMAVTNVTLYYEQVSYKQVDADYNTCTALAKTDGLSANIIVKLQGNGDSCQGSVESLAVSLDTSSIIVISVGTPDDLPINSVRTHFANEVPEAMETFLAAAAFNSWKSYDVCTGRNIPINNANETADMLLEEMLSGMPENMDVWGIVPGFWVGKPLEDRMASLNTSGFTQGMSSDKPGYGNVDYLIVFMVGNFSEVGRISRVSSASYQPTNLTQTIGLSWTMDIDQLNATYDEINYYVNATTYKMAQTVRTPKVTVTLSITYPSTLDTHQPHCSNVDYSTVINFGEGDLQYDVTAPDVPTSVIDILHEAAYDNLIADIKIGLDSMIINAAQYGISKICLNEI